MKAQRGLNVGASFRMEHYAPHISSDAIYTWRHKHEAAVALGIVYALAKVKKTKCTSMCIEKRSRVNKLSRMNCFHACTIESFDPRELLPQVPHPSRKMPSLAYCWADNPRMFSQDCTQRAAIIFAADVMRHGSRISRKPGVNCCCEMLRMLLYVPMLNSSKYNN